MTLLFLAMIDVTDEAIINSLFSAGTMTGRAGYTIESIPIPEIKGILRKYNKIK